MIRHTTIVLLSLIVASAASAQQTLIPTPYPSAAPGGQPLNPAPAPAPGGSQQIMQDPYPQTTGPNAQGNPPTAPEGGGQKLIPSANQRKYNVDEPPR